MQAPFRGSDRPGKALVPSKVREHQTQPYRTAYQQAARRATARSAARKNILAPYPQESQELSPTRETGPTQAASRTQPKTASNAAPIAISTSYSLAPTARFETPNRLWRPKQRHQRPVWPMLSARTKDSGYRTHTDIDRTLVRSQEYRQLMFPTGLTGAMPAG